MFAHGNSRIEFWLVTGTLSPSGWGEKEQPNSPAELFSLLSRKIKSSFNPRDPKQEGGGERQQEQRTSSITDGKNAEDLLGERAVSAIDYVEMKFHPSPPDPVIFNFSTSALNIFKLSPLENSGRVRPRIITRRINHTEEAKRRRGWKIWIRATRDHDEFI